MTKLFIHIYRFFHNHKALMWSSMVLLFVITGFFSSQIHLEEDLNKLMPESKNPDGTTKLAFSDLRIKDKTFLLFEYKNPSTLNTKSSTLIQDTLTTVCDEFVDSLFAIDNDSSNKVIGDIFYTIPDDLMPNGIEYLQAHIPSYIDTSAYAAFDTLLTMEHMRRQMRQNSEDFASEFGDMFPELIQQDPIGMRDVLKAQMEPLLSASGGNIRTINGHFFVPDGTVCEAFITPNFSATNTGQSSQLFLDLNSLIDKFQTLHPNVKISYYGTPASGYYNSSTIKNDLTGTLAWSLIIVLIILFVSMRNWSTIPLMLLPVVFGTLFGLTIMYFIKGQFSLLALGIGGIVLGVAMSYVLHILIHYKYVDDPEQVLRDETKSVLLGCITTIGSFMGLIFIKTDLLQDFGLFAAFAIIGTTVFGLIYLPHLMVLEKNKVNQRIFGLIDRINAYHIEDKKSLLWAIAIAIVIALVAYIWKGTDFDSNMDNLGYNAEETTYAKNLIQQKTNTALSSEYFAVEGKTQEEALENFHILECKLDSLQKMGLVKGYTHTTALFVPLKVQQQRIDAWNRYWTPERKRRVYDLISATCLQAGLTEHGFNPFFDMVEKDFKPNALYSAGLLPPGYESTMLEKTAAGNYLCFTNVSYANRKDYKRICDAIANEPNLMVLDTSYYTIDGLNNLNHDFNILQWISMAFVLVVLLLSFHFNLKHTLLGFAPILLSWLIVLGAMAIFDVRFNLINIIISTFIFGIGVDYSIFVMNGLIADTTVGSTTINHESLTLNHHKTAILFSAFILIVTVASMLFAEHPAIRSVGFATLVGLVSAVILSYVIQPAIFKHLKH